MDSLSLYSTEMSLFGGDIFEGLPCPLDGLDLPQDGIKSSDWKFKTSPESDLLSVDQHGPELGSDLLENNWFDTKVDLLDLIDENAEESGECTGFETLYNQRTLDLHSSIFELDVLESISSEITQSSVETSLETNDDCLSECVEFNLVDMLTENSDHQLDVENFPMVDDPILSPVSLEDVESLLSSEPASPVSCNGVIPIDDISLLQSSILATGNSSELENVVPESPSKSKTQKSRPAPYDRPVDKESKLADRKQRKKQQNKDAATRYRQKKKAEADAIDEEYNQIQTRNHELKDKVEQMTREIQYLKDLMAEVYTAKGLKTSKKSK